jgi:hypothetical protein
MAIDFCFRVEPELKSEAEAALKADGLDVNTAYPTFSALCCENGKGCQLPLLALIQRQLRQSKRQKPAKRRNNAG